MALPRLNLQRDTDVFYSSINLNDSGIGMNPRNTWKVDILAGYALAQDTSVQDITSAESGLTPDRSTQRFNTGLNQVQFNFQTYLRPTGEVSFWSLDANSKPLADWYLWQALFSNSNPLNTDGSAWTFGGKFDTTERAAATNVAAHNPNFAIPVTNYMYFKIGNIVYQLSNVSMNQAEVDGAIDTIAKTTWSGFASDMVELSGTNRDNAIKVFGGVSNDGTTVTPNAMATAFTSNFYHPYHIWNVSGTVSNAAFIINRLSTLTLNYTSESGATTVFNFPITRASVTYNNNITYLVPEEMDRLNRIAGQFAGARTISGNFTAYLRAGTTQSAGLLQKLLNDSRTALSVACNANLRIGGNTNPYVAFYFPAVHAQLPTHAIDDIIGISVDFLAQEPSTSLGSGGELQVFVQK